MNTRRHHPISVQQASQEAPSIEAKTTGKPDPKVKEPSIDNL